MQHDLSHPAPQAVPPGQCEAAGHGGALADGIGRQPAAWRKGEVLVFEVDEAPAAPSRRGRGRPRGTQGALVADHRPVTADDLRFLSAFVQGVDPRQAARSYLAHNLHHDGRSAFGYARQLLARLAARAEEHPERELALQLVAQLQQRLLQAMRPPRKRAQPPAEAGQGPGGAVSDALAKSEAARLPPRPAAPALQAQPLPAAPPSLEDFAAQFPDGMYSQAELLELYQEAFGAAAAPGGPGQGAVPAAPGPPETGTSPRPPGPAGPRPTVTLAQRLDVIEWLAARLAVPLAPHSALALWLEPALAQALRAPPLGLTTLGQLAAWINGQGAQFWRQVPGLGRRRALRLLHWVAEREVLLGVALRPSLKALLEPVQPLAQVYFAAPPRPAPLAESAEGGHPPARAAAARVPSLVAAPLASSAERGGRQHALVPLERFDWPGELAGADGYLRAREPSLLLHGGQPARDDREALAHFLRHYVDQRSAHTARAYRGALERFVLWAVLERRRPLSSMTREDFHAYRDFLYAPPAHWCSAARVMKHCDEWRPLRGPQSAKAVRQALDVVQLLYQWWHDHAYLRGNPARRLQAAPPEPSSDLGPATPALPPAGAPPLEAGRSFAREDLLAMERTFHSLPDNAAKRRLRAILSLFLESGLRRSEVQSLVLGKVTPIRDESNSLSAVRKMEVLGKGRRQRAVPILASTLEALQAHHRDRQQLIREGKLPRDWAQIPSEETPLLSVLRADRGRRAGRRGLAPASAPRVPSADGRLDGKTLYGILRQFFRQVAKQLPAAGQGLPGQADFERASTHWLRHTFALQYLAANPADLPGLQAILGHKDIATTGVYLQFGSLAQRARGIGRMERFFGTEESSESDAAPAPPAQGRGDHA